MNFPSDYPTLQTERLVLRKLLPEDAEGIFQLRSDESVNELIHRATAKSVDEAVAFINMINEKISTEQVYYWAITLDSKLIGTICLFNFDKENGAEIGFELMKEFRRKGYTQESFQAVKNFVFDHLRLKRLIGVVNRQNPESIALLEKNHFRPVNDPAIDTHPSDQVYILTNQLSF